jgi:predicted Zn-dependent protease
MTIQLHRLFRLHTLWALGTAALLLCGCSLRPSSAVAQPAIIPSVVDTFSEEPAPRPVDVWLIPLEGFPNNYVTDLVERLTKDTGLRIRATVSAGRSPAMAFPDGNQFNSDKIISELRPAMAGLSDSATPKTVYVILTTDDINQGDRSLRFVFAVTEPQYNVAVVSIARMQQDQTPVLTKIRLFKMTKKAVGTLYYHHPRNTDMNSVMYSPIMGLDDLDMIGTDY